MPFPMLGQPSLTLCPVSAQGAAGQVSEHRSSCPVGAQLESLWSHHLWLLPPLMRTFGSHSHELEQTQSLSRWLNKTVFSHFCGSSEKFVNCFLPCCFGTKIKISSG